MSTSIHQVLNLPPKGSAMSLGPVKIEASYPISTTGNGKQYRNITVSDSSGKSKMTIWGASANININKGDTVTFIGKIKRNDYNGNTTISSEDVKIDGASEAPEATSNGGTSSFSAPAASSNKLPIHELARQMALFTFEFQEALRAMEIKNEIADQLIARAPEYAALWWFGEKQLKEVNPDEASDDPY